VVDDGEQDLASASRCDAGDLEPGEDANVPWLRVAAIALCLLAVGAALFERMPSGAMLALGVAHGLVLGIRPRWMPALLVFDLGLVGWQSAHQAPDSFQSIYDSWVHMALARRVVDFGPFPPNAFYAEHGAAPLYSFVHLVQGGASALFGVPVTDVWRWGHPVAVVGIGVAGYFAHRELLRRESAAVIAGLTCVVVFRFAWGYAGYPRVVGPAFNLLALGLAFRALRSGGFLPALGAGVALGLAFACHPVSGGLGAALLGLILFVELANGWWAGGGVRRTIRVSATIVAASIVVAAPWLVADAVAWMHRLPGVAAAPGIAFSEFVRTKLSLRLGYVAWPALPIGAVAAGCLCALARPKDRLLWTYLAAAGLLGGVLPLTVAGARLADWFGPEYVMRLVELFPLPALFGLAFTAFDHPALARRRLLRSSGLVAAAGCVSLLLYDLAPWERSLVGAPVPSRLVALEPIVRDRVVVAPPVVAYLLPALTGAFVAWNGFEGHGNRWIFDPRRKEGAERILAGRLEPGGEGGERWTDYMERYRVELVFLPRSLVGARRALLATGHFSVVDEGSAYVLLEYQPGAARPTSAP